MGYPLTGGSFLQVASEEAHLVLLPAANTVFTQENDALNAASGQATELPTMLAAFVLALVTAYVLYRAQRWLTRRTNRVLSPGLVLASLLLVISVIWLAAGFLAARSDLDGGIAHGSRPAQNLALASIDVQQIRGDAVLNVISRSGSTSFQTDFLATSKKVGPGNGSLLGAAAAAQQAGGQGAALVATAAAGRDRLVRGQQPGVPARQRRPTTPPSGTWSSAPGAGSTATGVQRARRRPHPARSPPTRPSSTPPPPTERTRSTRWPAS